MQIVRYRHYLQSDLSAALERLTKLICGRKWIGCLSQRAHSLDPPLDRAPNVPSSGPSVDLSGLQELTSVSVEPVRRTREQGENLHIVCEINRHRGG